MSNRLPHNWHPISHPTPHYLNDERLRYSSDTQAVPHGATVRIMTADVYVYGSYFSPPAPPAGIMLPGPSGLPRWQNKPFGPTYHPSAPPLPSNPFDSTAFAENVVPSPRLPPQKPEVMIEDTFFTKWTDQEQRRVAHFSIVKTTAQFTIALTIATAQQIAAKRDCVSIIFWKEQGKDEQLLITSVDVLRIGERAFPALNKGAARRRLKALKPRPQTINKEHPLHERMKSMPWPKPMNIARSGKVISAKNIEEALQRIATAIKPPRSVNFLG